MTAWPRLSICIATYNRSDFIAETIASIQPQLRDNVELVVFDGASPDDTAAVVGRFVAADARIRYVCAEAKSGIDQDFDIAVSLAKGEYCWLFSDDDLILPGAVDRVLKLLDRDSDLVIVDAEVRDTTLSEVLEPRRIPFEGERSYTPEDTDDLLADAGNALSFIGGTIIRRSLWIARNRQKYYDTLFIHVGVIFQAPVSAIVVGEPLVAIRYGNASWSARRFEIWMRLWPNIIWSLPAADWAKQAVVEREPWRSLRKVALYRANGSIDRASYQSFIPREFPLWRRAALLGLTTVPEGFLGMLITLWLRRRGLLRGCYGYDLLRGPNASTLAKWIGGS
jgi:abequosyltransferase